MPIVQAKCTNCAAALQIDDTKEAALCEFCHTPFIVEKAIKNYNTFITNNNNYSGASINVIKGDIQNFLKLSESAFRAGDGIEALEYANKALELDVNSSQAWLLKMYAMKFIGTVGDPKVSDIISYATNAIDNSIEEQKEETQIKIYRFYLERALELYSVALSNIMDTESVKNNYKVFARISPMSANQKMHQIDSTTLTLMNTLCDNALYLKMNVPDDVIEKDESLQSNVKSMAQTFNDYICEYIQRISIYGAKLTDEAKTTYENHYKSLRIGLSDENKKDLTTDIIPKSSSGCYIATAVYGSYDCPQVWTLRRYRDQSLATTSYGRTFIRTYYAISPKLINWFGDTKWFKKICKSKLDYVVNVLQLKGFQNTPYDDANWN